MIDIGRREACMWFSLAPFSSHGVYVSVSLIFVPLFDRISQSLFKLGAASLCINYVRALKLDCRHALRFRARSAHLEHIARKKPAQQIIKKSLPTQNLIYTHAHALLRRSTHQFGCLNHPSTPFRSFPIYPSIPFPFPSIIFFSRSILASFQPNLFTFIHFRYSFRCFFGWKDAIAYPIPLFLSSSLVQSLA
jgi:hypothetical protein